MLPAATLPAARYYVTPARRRACGRGLAGLRREARGREEPARDAAAGLAEVLAMPAIWKDAAGNLLLRHEALLLSDGGERPSISLPS